MTVSAATTSFKVLGDRPTRRLVVDGRPLDLPVGATLAAALLVVGHDDDFRPFCQMGMCGRCEVALGEPPRRVRACRVRIEAA
jgi:hypothetical protein